MVGANFKMHTMDLLRDKYMQERPVYLNLIQFKFPITAILSILHRISGVILLFVIPFFLSQLDTLMHYPQHYSGIRDALLNRPEKKIILLCGLILFAYHFYAGLRHVIMDIGFGEGKCAATISSYVVFALTIITAIIMGISIW